MNNNLIENLIKLNSETCPEFIYSNPLLDRDVARALSNSVVKMVCDNDGNQRVKKSFLQTIRNVCKTVPEGHLEIEEDLTELLTSSYEKELETTVTKNDIDKQLDAFLIKKSNAVCLSTIFQPAVKPEILQAMLNLDQSIAFSDTICKDIIHWNVNDQKSSTVLQNLWNEKEMHTPCFYNNISVNMKSKIECILLSISHRVLENNIIDIEDILSSDTNLKSLINACLNSAEFFQICISILNSLFVATNYNASIERFIHFFIQDIKLKGNVQSISVLYPECLSNLVTILDFNLDELPNRNSIKENYINIAKKYLKTLSNQSENNLIMLLSHFPQWFDIYFDK